MKRNSFAVIFFKLSMVTLLFAVPLTAQSKRDQVRKLKDKAAAAEKLKNYREAADAYAQILALTPNDADAHYRKGFAHYSLKENDQAVSDFSLALTKGYKPQLNIYKVRYFVYLDQKNYDAALADIQKGLAIAPNDLDLLSAVGEINFDRKAYPQALAAFQKASLAAPNNADLYYNIARVYFATGDSKSQVGAAESALAKGTRFPGESYYLLAEANHKLRNIPAAIDAYQRAINSKPETYQLYRTLADIFRSENRFTEAISISKKAQILFLNDGNLYTDLSLFYSLADRPQDAVDAGKAAVLILPNQPAGHTNLCRAYNETKSYSQAISACNEALRLKPGDGETLFYLGRAYNLSGKTVEATKFYAQAVTGLLENVKNDPASSESWYLLGNAYFTDNQRDKALEAYIKCLEISPKFAKARYNLGIIYTLTKQKPAAVEQYDRLVALDARLAQKLREEIDRM